jgi:suppressor of ftsI
VLALRGAAAALLALVVASPAVAQRPCDPETPLGPSRDLYCVELIPAPGIAGASGMAELGPVPGPFTVAVTADGRLRYRVTAIVSGLPEPRTLGSYRTYVAWAATPTMYPIVRLGEIADGRTELGDVDFEKFVVLISAEPHARVAEPSGRFVLRGQSPSTRLFPPDLLDFSLGRMGVAPSGGHHEHHATPGDTGLRWTTVPMPAGLTMLPAEMALRPEVEPFLPGGAAPTARPREVVRAKDGDTLRLQAGLVTRTLKGRSYTMFAFNGQYPGPLIQVARGSRLTVEFTNRLPQPTTVHWHGIRLDYRNDGVPDLSQPVVQPGDSFTYHLRFPDDGIFWYHPHVREDVQQELGLYGNLLVRGDSAQYGPAHREEVLMLDDILVGEDGMVPLGAESPTHALMGRFGNIMLVNGEPEYRLSVSRGEVVRFYLTNAANTRTFNLAFEGARMKVVGSDVGPFARESWVESVVIAPAERYVVDVRFDRPGRTSLLNRVRGLDHLYGKFFAEIDTLGLVEVGGRRATPDLGASFARLARSRAAAEMERFIAAAPPRAGQALVLTLETEGLPIVTQRLMQLDSIYFSPMEWSGTMPMMNWASSGRQVRWILRDPATGKENMDSRWNFRRGHPVRVRLLNERRSFHAMQHPIHLHGQRFLVLEVNGVPVGNPAWKDTVLLPAGSAVDILLDPSNPGRWMLHCHIAEHLSAGMMMSFEVE